MDLVVRMLYDPQMFPLFVALWTGAEAVLTFLVIRLVSCEHSRPFASRCFKLTPVRSRGTDTNIDYLAYTQQAALFLSPNNERVYSKLIGDTGPLVYPALHLYIYSSLHKMFPRASLVDVAGFVPGSNSTMGAVEEGAAMGGKGSSNALLPLQRIWLGVYCVTLVLLAIIAGQAYSSVQARGPRPARRFTSLRQLATRLVTGPTPLPVLLAALSLSLRLHSIYVLRLFNDPIAMVLLYASVWLLTKSQWKVGSVVYS